MSFSDLVTSITTYLVPPHTDSVTPSNSHCCPILTQYTDSSSRNAHLSQLDVVLPSFYGHFFGGFNNHMNWSDINPHLCIMCFITFVDRARANLVLEKNWYILGIWIGLCNDEDITAEKTHCAFYESCAKFEICLWSHNLPLSSNFEEKQHECFVWKCQHLFHCLTSAKCN